MYEYDENFIKELRGLVKKTLSYKYYKATAVRQFYDIDDLVQDFMLRYLSNGRNGEQRLAYYLRTCESEKHFENSIKMAVSQIIPAMMRNKLIKNKVYFLDDLMDYKSNQIYSETLKDKMDVEKLYEFKEVINQFTGEEQELFKGLFYGERRTDLRKKFKNFDELLGQIKEKILNTCPEYLNYLSKDKI